MELGPGTVVGGKYRIERALARGGMGSVWVARHVQLGSTLAIKFLDASFAASAAHRARFEREARASANLKSPHVVSVQDYGFEGDAPYLVMELLDGEDLGQRLHRVKRMSLRDTAKVLTHVGKALRKAHEAGIAHRDLKPANLFIARVDDDEIVKILDFGIAKDANSTLGDATRTGEVIGSPHYMSPEQVRAEKDLDYRTDLWSLGIILFRMLVGSLPFPGDQLGPVLAKILTDPIPVPSQHAPDLGTSLDAFFARALARDKLQRFQSVVDMVEAFQLAAGGKDAFPSISMSLGTGAVPVAVPPGGGTAMWVPQGPQTGPITGSALQSYVGPPTGAMAGSGVQGMTGPHTGAHTGQQMAPITGTGPQTGAVAGTTGGLASTGQAQKAKGPGVAVAVVAVMLAFGAAAAAVFWLFIQKPPADAGALAVAPPSASAAVTVAPVAPSLLPSAPASVEPVPSASASASTAPTASGTAVAKPGGARPKAAPAGTKEKWF